MTTIDIIQGDYRTRMESGLIETPFQRHTKLADAQFAVSDLIPEIARAAIASVHTPTTANRAEVARLIGAYDCRMAEADVWERKAAEAME